jgi:hypothetical protein
MKRKSSKPKRSKNLFVACTPEEFDNIKARWRQSTSRKFNEYARKVLQDLPVVLTYRNLSIDNLIDAVNETREDLRKLVESAALTDSEKGRLTGLLQEIKDEFYQIANLCIPK